MLANIYLDALDKELERRGHTFCRFADDCNIYVGSRAAAERTLTSIQGWIETHLRLKVLLGSTAVYGKPYVRWCGRVTGRNPRHSTRSHADSPKYTR